MIELSIRAGQVLVMFAVTLTLALLVDAAIRGKGNR